MDSKYRVKLLGVVVQSVEWIQSNNFLPQKIRSRWHKAIWLYSNLTTDSEDGQFQPFLEDYTELFTWSDKYYRTIRLLPKEKSEVKGLTVHV